ncbi:MAG: hypothetical protein SGBAC_007065 [Bacillariaceae sp.]
MPKATAKSVKGKKKAGSPPASASKKTKIKYMTRKQANFLLIESELKVQNAQKDWARAREICDRAGLSVDNPIVPKVEGPETTGGHSNTDHMVIRTGDVRRDRIAELKRNLLRRARAMQPEHRGEDRWDKPRIPGERRRRILRERDRPEAPPEPPHTGFVVFVGQMTVKIRHDRPNIPHDQSRVVSEIAKNWRVGMSEEEKAYYNQFAAEAKQEYDQQVVEYRATGSFRPSHSFSRLEGTNIWIRKHFQNGLEKEISQYPTAQFPKRPAAFDEAYNQREERRVLRRKLKVKGLVNEDGTLKDGLDFEELLQKEREKNHHSNATSEDGSMDEDNTTGNDNVAEDMIVAGDDVIGMDDTTYRQAYVFMTRKEKADITRRIVQEIKSTGARFIRRFNDAGEDKWVEVDDKTAYNKVSHALRLKKSDQVQRVLKSRHGQPGDIRRSLMLNSTSRTEPSTSHNVAAMPSGPQNVTSHLSRFSPSPSLGLQCALSTPQHPLQIEIQSQAASHPSFGMQLQSIVSPSVVSGYWNSMIDPRLCSQVLTSKLAHTDVAEDTIVAGDDANDMEDTTVAAVAV